MSHGANKTRYTIEYYLRFLLIYSEDKEGTQSSEPFIEFLEYKAHYQVLP